MSDLLVGVDCDGVLYHWDRTCRYMLRRKYKREGRDVPDALHQPARHWYGIKEAVEPEDWQWLWEEGVRDGLFRYGHVVGGSLEGMAALNEMADIVIVTSRPEHAVSDTLAWLSLMLDKIDLRGIHVLSHGQPKSSVKPTPDILIDDGPHNIRDWVKNTDGYAIVFDQPWNAHEDDLEGFIGVGRAFGWRHAVDLVQQVAEEEPTRNGFCAAVRPVKWDILDREVI